MPGLPDCLVCPFRDDPDLLCWCAAKGFVGLCEGLAGKRRKDQVEGFRRLIVEVTTGVPQPEPAPCPDPPPTAEDSPRIAAELAVAKAVGRCEHRKRGPHCGCSGMMRCERDAADVAWGDCVACKAAEAQTAI